jgi:hypothetical protein
MGGSFGIFVHLEGLDEVREGLESYGKDANKLLGRILYRVAVKFRSYVRNNYLSGQVLRRITGKLWQNMTVWKSKRAKNTYVIGARAVPSGPGFVGLANIYSHAGGANIVPRNAKVLHWKSDSGKDIFRPAAHLDYRPFMKMAADSFPFDATIGSIANQVIMQENAKRGLL